MPAVSDRRSRKLGLKLYWISQVSGRELAHVEWYVTGTGRDDGRRKFAAEKHGDKAKYTRIENVER